MGALMIIDLYQSDPQNNLPDNMFYVLWLLVDWKKRKNEMGNASICLLLHKSQEGTFLREQNTPITEEIMYNMEWINV